MSTTRNGASAQNSPNIAAAHAKLKAIDRRHGEFYDALTDAFALEVQTRVAKAVAALVDQLRQSLTFDAQGNIERTPANIQIIAKLDQAFEDLMERYGYAKVVNAFVNEFPGQLPLLKEELDLISAQLKVPLVQGPILAAPDLKVLAAQQSITKSSLIDIVGVVGDLTKRKAMLSVGGLGMRQMTDLLATSLGKTPGEARTLGATSLAMFYRTANARAIDRIEANNRGQAPLHYKYAGPEDKLNRPFCKHLLELNDAGKAWTRAEIDRMNNGQIPNVFESAGGFNCRHQFRIALPDELPQATRDRDAHKRVIADLHRNGK